jgi:hypothetical protein
MKFALQQFYMIESWALVALGVLHTGTTLRLYNAFTLQAHWFMGAGILMILVGALNLLNRKYGGAARGLRLVCIGANIVILAYSVAGGVLGRADLVAWIIVLGIVVPLTALSFSRTVNR